MLVRSTIQRPKTNPRRIEVQDGWKPRGPEGGRGYSNSRPRPGLEWLFKIKFSAPSRVMWVPALGAGFAGPLFGGVRCVATSAAPDNAARRTRQADDTPRRAMLRLFPSGLVLPCPLSRSAFLLVYFPSWGFLGFCLSLGTRIPSPVVFAALRPRWMDGRAGEIRFRWAVFGGVGGCNLETSLRGCLHLDSACPCPLALSQC